MPRKEAELGAGIRGSPAADILELTSGGKGSPPDRRRKLLRGEIPDPMVV